MRTLVEVEQDIDKVKQEFDRLLDEKFSLQMKEAKYFCQDVTISLYTKDNVVKDSDIYYLCEMFSNNCDDVIVVLDPHYKNNKMPITKEEYEKAASL